MKKNRESYSEIFKDEIKWCKENLQPLTETKNKFMIEMYTILVSGGRKITPKMADAIKNGIERCKNNPKFNPVLKTEAEAKLKPILEKIVMVERLAEQKNDKAQANQWLKTPRNAPCPCESGKKYKHCHGKFA